MTQYFKWTEFQTGRWVFQPVYSHFGGWTVNGSWNLMGARLLGLDWPDFLRYCRQCGAEVIGKGNLYPFIKWTKPNDAFLKELNIRANALVKLEEE